MAYFCQLQRPAEFRSQPGLALHFHHRSQENTGPKPGCFLLTVCSGPITLLYEDLKKKTTTTIIIVAILIIMHANA